MGRFLPPDHAAGDANTVGGYLAVHQRPAAFEGRDGASYSVEIMVDETGDTHAPYAAYLLFVRWGVGNNVAEGHLETKYLVTGQTELDVQSTLGRMLLSDARRELDAIIAERGKERPWYEAMDDA